MVSATIVARQEDSLDDEIFEKEDEEENKAVTA